jgi:chromate transporter
VVAGIALDLPVLATVRPWAVILSMAALIAMFRFKAGAIPVLAACSAAGVVLYLLGAVSP